MRRHAGRTGSPDPLEPRSAFKKTGLFVLLTCGLFLLAAVLGDGNAEVSAAAESLKARSESNEGRLKQNPNLRNPLPAQFPSQKLDRLASGFGGRIGFYARNLANGAEYSWNGDQRFPPASVIKLPVMIELYRQAAAGSLDLEAKEPLPPDVSTHGSGVLKRRDGPIALTLREYCRLMMVHSDNMATDLVMRKVGLESVNRLLGELGLENTRASMDLGRWHYLIVGLADAPISRKNDARILEHMRAGKYDDGLGYSDSLDNNVCGPRDIGSLLAKLYGGELASRQDTDEMLELMRTSTHKRTIAKYVKEGIRVANKYGGSRRIAADSGIVELSTGPVVIAAFALSADPTDRSGREILARMARLAVAAVDPNAVKPIPHTGR